MYFESAVDEGWQDARSSLASIESLIESANRILELIDIELSGR